MALFRYLLICVLLIGNQTNALSNDIRLTVLSRGIVNKTFVFDKSKGNDYDKTTLKYLGTLKTNKGVGYKIMSLCWIWGISQRATSRILVYTLNNKYVGDYYLSSLEDLPVEIKNNQIVFKGIDSQTKQHITQTINFNDGILRCIIINGSESCFDKG